MPRLAYPLPFDPNHYFASKPKPKEQHNMNTNETPMRTRKTYTQPVEVDIHIPFYTEQEVDEHKHRIDFVLRSPEPKTFKEYQTWLHEWRKVIHRVMQLQRECTVAHAQRKLAGGYGRRQENCKLKMTPKIEAAWKTVIDNLRTHGRLCMQELIELRVARKPLGKALWEADRKS